MRPAVIFAVAASIMGAAFSANAEAPDEAMLQQGKALFLTKAAPACAICHTLADAGSEGTIGPDLDEIKPDSATVRKALYEGLGVMPNFSETLTEEEIEAVANYVAHAVGH